MQFADHLLLAGQLCLVPGHVSADYMEWFFRISHPFMTPTQAADPQVVSDPQTASTCHLSDRVTIVH